MTNNQLPIERWKDWHRKIPYGKIGFGYKIDPNDTYHIIPDPDEIIILEQAFDYIDAGSSWREVGEWTSQKLLKSITHQTVSNLYKKHRKPFLRVKTNRKAPRKALDPESQKIATAKRAVISAVKRAKKLEDEKRLREKQVPIDPNKVDGRKNNGGFVVPDEAKKYLPPVPKEVSFAFTPNPGPQTDFLSASEPEILFGGAAGGEPKSWFPAPFSK